MLALAWSIADAAVPVTTNIVTLATNDLVSNPVTGVLYGSTSSGLTTINPVTGTIGSSYAIAGSPGQIVISSDGSYIYAVVNGGNAVERFNLQTSTTDLEFTLPGTGTEYVQEVRNIYAIPGQPNSVLLARYYPNFSPPAGGTFVYQNGVQLPDSVGFSLGEGGPDIIAIDETGQHAFGYNSLISSWSIYAMSLSSSGVTQIGGYAGGYLSGNIGRIAVAGGKLFDSSGQIYDLLSGANLGSFAGAGNFYLDAADNMFYSVADGSGSSTIYAYNLSTLGLMGSANITGVSGSTSSLTRYGGNGLAFSTATQVFAVNSALVPYTWAATTGGSWNDGTRWTGGAAPNLTDVIANLGGSISQASTVTVTSPITVGSIFFNNSNSYTVSGSAAVTLQSSSGTANLQAILGSHTISAPLVLATSTAVIISQPSATLTISGLVSGTGGLSCSGSGTVVLSNANSYTGNTLVSSGGLNLAHPLAVQNSNVNVGAGGVLSFAAGVTSPILGGLAGGGNVALATAASEPVTLNAGGNGQSTTYNGSLTGPGGLTKMGSGMLSLTGSSTYAGATVISGGVLQLNGSARNPVSAGLIYDVDASNPNNYTVNGSGYVTQLNDISGNGNNFVNANSTVTAVSGVSGFNGKNVLNFNGTANATLAMGNSSSPETVFIIEQVKGSITGDDGMFGWTGNDHDIRIASATSIYNPGNVNDFTNGSGGAMYINAVLQSGNAPASTPQLLAAYAGGSTTSTFPWNSTSLSNNTFMNRDFDGYIGEVVAYSSSLSASQFQAVEAYLNAKWGLGISGFPAATGGGNNLLPSGTRLTIAAGATLDLSSGSQQLASLSDYAPGSGGSIINSSTVASVLTLSLTGGSTTFSGMIQGGGSLGTISLVMNGAGTQVLTGPNTYTGATTISGGTLTIGGNGSLGALGNYVGNIAVNGAGTLFNYNSTAAQTLSGALSGSGAVIQNGPGTLTLAGNNSSFSGGISVLAGALVASSPWALGTGNVTVAGGATFAYLPATPGALNVPGTLTFNNNSTVGLSLGGTQSQSVVKSTAVAAGGNFTVNIYGIPGVAPAPGVNNLLTTADGLGTATFGTVYNATNFTISNFTFNRRRGQRNRGRRDAADCGVLAGRLQRQQRLGRIRRGQPQQLGHDALGRDDEPGSRSRRQRDALRRRGDQPRQHGAGGKHVDQQPDDRRSRHGGLECRWQYARHRRVGRDHRRRHRRAGDPQCQYRPGQRRAHDHRQQPQRADAGRRDQRR